MLAVRHYPELCTPELLDWLRLHVRYNRDGRACRWLVEDGHLPPELMTIAEQTCPDVRFQGVILQAYRDGRATTECHSDAGATGFCMILSLGATRTFRVHRVPPGTRPQSLCTTLDLDPFEIECAHGTAILMDESFQESWHHQLIGDPGVTEERLSLVFRTRPEQRG